MVDMALLLLRGGSESGDVDADADEEERDEHRDELETKGDEWLIAVPNSSQFEFSLSELSSQSESLADES